MITIRRLKELIKDIPDDAMCFGYEGEDTGIVINKDKRQWFIRCTEANKEDTHIEGFEVKERLIDCKWIKMEEGYKTDCGGIIEQFQGDIYCPNCGGKVHKTDNETIISYLRSELYGESNRSEKLNPSNFENNDHYKVTYRFLANMLGCWEKKFPSMPTLEEAKEIAKQVDPYFVWLLNNEEEGWVFTNNYEFVADAWK